MPTCCVPGCTSGYRKDKSSSDRHFFFAPSDEGLLVAWNRAVPRADKNLSAKSRVCDLHFHHQDIQKTYVHIIEGKTVEIPRGKWSLTKNAVPKVFPNLPSYLSKPPEKRRRERRGDAMVAHKAHEEHQGDFEKSEDGLCFSGSPGVDLPAIDDLKCIQLPPHWRVITLHDSNVEFIAFFSLKLVENALQIEKCVVVSSDMLATASAYGCAATAFSSVTVLSPDDLAAFLRKVDKLHVCEGCRGPCSHCSSSKCKVLSPQPVCASCRVRKKRLLREGTRKRSGIARRHNKVRNLKKKLMRAASKKVSFMQSIKELKNQLTVEKTNSINEALSSLPPLQQLAFQTSLKQLQAKSPRGVRYSRTWSLNCLLLRIASPKAYNMIRNMKLLPLPTCSRLSQIISGVPTDYGYNEVALKTIGTFFKDKSIVERLGTLILDEVKLRQSVEFNKSTYKFDGFIDFGTITAQGNAVAADHALVIMFVPLFHKWVQPVASFATRGAAPGFVLAKLILESVLQLEQHGASIIAVVSDGAGNNRSMWTHVGVSGKIDKVVNKIPHPSLEDGRFLHFLCDAPHIVKCVRNNLLTHTFAKAGSDLINFGHYRLLHNTEKDKQLKIVPKLTASHVNPGKMEKMNVRLATQLFSRSVAIGMKFYREQHHPEFHDTVGTESFTLRMNNLFDALNARCPAEGIRKGSPKIKVIKDFLEMLDATERSSIAQNTRMFASQMTMESLRVTLSSVLDIIALLHNQNVTYVLTAKLNQDPLERFFGVVRCFGGHEDHPTITHFGQIFRLLSLYTPLKVAIKGNCTGEVDPVLVAVDENLNSMRLDALSKKQAREKELRKIISQIDLKEATTDDRLQHSYSRPTAKESALYYLAGYIAKKIRKFSTCDDCLMTCVSTQHVPPAAVLTEMRSFKPGALQHPSGALSSMISAIECVIEEKTKTNEVFGDLFWSILEQLSKMALVKVGCSLHYEELSARVIKFYLTTRMYFYSKFVQQHQSSSIQVKAARKRAKLL